MVVHSAPAAKTKLTTEVREAIVLRPALARPAGRIPRPTGVDDLNEAAKPVYDGGENGYDSDDSAHATSPTISMDAPFDGRSKKHDI